jgi:hypothetical protein
MAAVSVQRPVRILAGFYKRATQLKHRRVIDNRDTHRRAGIAADQLGANYLCRMIRSILLVAEMTLLV